MEWIQNNRFLAGLIGVTVLCLGALIYWGNAGASRYEDSLMNFGNAIADVQRIEQTKPYPIEANRAAKKKAIEDFRADLEALQQRYDEFRPGALKNISPERFIDRLVEVNKATVGAAGKKALALPDEFFSGFKEYTGKQPLQQATGVLGYQLEAVNEVLMVLADSGATSLVNLHRPALEEEKGKRFEPSEQAVARALPLEFTFRGPEKSLRKFVTTLSASDKNYWIIRSLRVGNEKTEPPRVSDAKFEERRKAPDAGPAQPFGFEFDFQDDPEAADPEGEEPPAPEDEPVAPPAAADVGEGERILSLVLGNEELIVHLRVDLMMFLEPKPLP